MDSAERWRADFGIVFEGADRGLSVADRLCHACVDLLQVDGAAVSLLHDGATQGTFGSSCALSRQLDEFQFTFGEGPCLDAVGQGAPVLVADLTNPVASRWPAFTDAVLGQGVQAVFALPISLIATPIGALALFRYEPGAVTPDALAGGLLAAELATLPLLDLMTADVDWDSAAQGGSGWEELASLERVEVYQATGMVMEAFGLGSTDALVRLRAHAYASGRAVGELAIAIVERRFPLDDDDWRRRPDDQTRRR